MVTATHILKAALPASLKKAVKRLIRQHIDRQPEPLRLAFLNLWKEFETAEIVRQSARSFEALKGKKGLKVQLGCGSEMRPGWVNIDLKFGSSLALDLNEHPDTVLIRHDLRRGLPLEEGSCDYVYSSHFFEHLEYRYGSGLMRDCYRVLRPGGTFRIVLPNTREGWGQYLRGNNEYFDLIDILKTCPYIEPGTETLIDYVNYKIYQRGEHKYCYDEEKVVLLLGRIGYSSVAPASYQPGIDSDTPIRLRYSFYIEAIK